MIENRKLNIYFPGNTYKCDSRKIVIILQWFVPHPACFDHKIGLVAVLALSLNFVHVREH